MTFICSCVDWPTQELPALSAMIDQERDVTRATFRKHVDPLALARLEEELGYARTAKGGLTMAADYHVSYYRSTLKGRRVYFVRHSLIEYVFEDTWRGYARGGRSTSSERISGGAP